MRKKYACSEGCKPDTDTPFYYSSSVCNFLDGDETNLYELGVLVYPDLRISNRWTDGVAGIPDTLRKALDEYGELPDCVECGANIKEI